MDQKKPEEWFKAKERGVRCSRLREPYGNIFVGSDPLDGMTEEEAKSFNAIVNVSCSPCAYFHPAYPGQAMHWTPINEMGYWGLAPFFWFKKVMDFHHERGHRVYVHCHAGAYRSPTFTVYWLISRGHSLDEALEIEYNNDKVVKEFKEEKNGRHWKWKREYPYKCGNINPKVVDMLQRMEKKPEYSFGGIVHHPGGPLELTREIFGSRHWSAKWRYTFWWWYEPMYWIGRRIDYAMYYVKGCKVDRPPGSFGWHISPREDILGRICYWTAEKARVFAYRLSKPKLPIWKNSEETPSISLF